jgi:hypothetical protein
MYGLGWFPIHNLLYFARIHRYAILGNSVPKKFHTIQPKFTFGELCIKIVILQTLQNNSEMFCMFFIILGIDYDIVNEYHYKLVQLRHEYGVHEVHEVSGCIGKTEGHHRIRWRMLFWEYHRV